MTPSSLFCARSLLIGASLCALGCSSSLSSKGASSKDSSKTPSLAASVENGASAASPGGIETVVAPNGTNNEGPPVLDFGAESPAGSSDVTACVGQTSQAEFVAVDLFVMLDISGSMLEMTPAGTDKWTAVKSALQSFLRAPSSSGLGVGIQYFPLNQPGVPERCGSDAECGIGGPCMLDVCLGALSQGARVPCQIEQDCQGGSANSNFGPCSRIGVCSADPSYLCQIPGLPCVLDTGPAGICQLSNSGVCPGRVACEAPTYATPAVAIATLPDAAPALLASINAQTPSGGTPSGPALSGAIQQAREWALSHPGHAVAALLATDGLPTNCAPLDIAGLGDIAASGFTGSPSIRTFAIGVFGSNDPAGPANLDVIARSGGTKAAFVIDTSQDISAQFLDALNAIRGSRLGCEFELPVPSVGAALDYDLVNVDLTEATGKARIFRVAGLDACGSEGGWYYDDVVHPTRIVACPASCGRLKSATLGASVEIQLGCRTLIR